MLMMVKSCIKIRFDSQAYKSTDVAKGPFFPCMWTQRIKSVEQSVTQDPI
jgi:hypothetical protein